MFSFNLTRIPSENRDTEGRILALLNMSCRTIALPEACILDIACPGPADDAVAAWVDSEDIDWSDVTPDDIRRELRECGAWDAEELADDVQNRHRILWVLAWNVADDAEAYGGGL